MDQDVTTMASDPQTDHSTADSRGSSGPAVARLDVIRLAGAAGIDPRTAARYLRGERVQPLIEGRINEAIASGAYTPTHANAGHAARRARR